MTLTREHEESVRVEIVDTQENRVLYICEKGRSVEHDEFHMEYEPIRES